MVRMVLKMCTCLHILPLVGFYKFRNLRGKCHKVNFSHEHMFDTFGPWRWSSLYSKTTTHFNYYFFVRHRVCVVGLTGSTVRIGIPGLLMNLERTFWSYRIDKTWHFTTETQTLT